MESTSYINRRVLVYHKGTIGLALYVLSRSHYMICTSKPVVLTMNDASDDLLTVAKEGRNVYMTYVKKVRITNRTTLR